MEDTHMRSVMKHQFSQVPEATIPRSSFDRSHGYKTTFDSGWLIPVFVDEALPGDTFNCKMTTFARLSTPLKPIMDNMFCDVFFFAVPLRLVWTNFVKFMGEQDNPSDSTSYLVPQVVAGGGGFTANTIYDYFGLPIAAPSISVSALPFRAYNLIWNEWFRDQNLQNSSLCRLTDGPDPVTDFTLLKRGKRHDYFTSALPWPQKGPAVNIPLGTSAPVVPVTPGSSYPGFTGGGLTGSAIYSINATTQAGLNGVASSSAPMAWATTGLQTDLTAATSATINSLRQAFQVQKIYERDARGGTRYTELIQAHFGVTSPDARLQRPEYLGGGSCPVNVNPIAQTGGTGTTGTTTPQGNLAAIGTMSHSGIGFTKSFTEHSILIGLVSVRADLNYQQGLNRMWSRSSRFDFYWPALAQIGEQAILNKEIYCKGDANDPLVFGYQERFAEYRYKPSVITGQFRSSFATPLDTWHLAQNFTALPTLNSTFIVETPPISRVVAVPSQPQFLFDAYFSMQCARPMPVYGVPGNIDRL